jgi:hypothetical protein
MVLAPVAETPWLEEFDPVRDNATQGLHGQLIKPTVQEFLQGRNVSDVKGVRFVGDGIICVLALFDIIVVKSGLAIVCWSLGDGSSPLQALRLEQTLSLCGRPLLLARRRLLLEFGVLLRFGFCRLG